MGVLSYLFTALKVTSLVSGRTYSEGWNNEGPQLPIGFLCSTGCSKLAEKTRRSPTAHRPARDGDHRHDGGCGQWDHDGEWQHRRSYNTDTRDYNSNDRGANHPNHNGAHNYHSGPNTGTCSYQDRVCG